jgi:hypothetical protein
MPPPKWLTLCRKVRAESQAERYKSQTVDSFTAAAVCLVWDGANEKNREKLRHLEASQGFAALARVCFSIVT